MAARKSVLGPAPNRPELDKLLEEARKTKLTDDQITEQRISFAYGNAPDSARITKETVRETSKRFRVAS